MTNLGHEVTILYNGPPSITPGVNTIFTPVIGNKYFDKGLAIPYKIISGIFDEVDIVHSFSTVPTSGIPGYLKHLIKGCPWVVDWPDLEGYGGFGEQANLVQRKIVHYFERWMISRCDGVTVISPYLAERAKVYRAKKVHYLPNGADLEHLGFPHEENEKQFTRREIREELGLGESPIVLFIGLFHKSTDADFLIRSMRYVLEDAPEVKFVLVGEGPKKRGFRSLAKSLGVEQHIVWQGMQPQSKIRGFIEAADVVALPIRDNIANKARNPIKLMEYLAVGKAVVTNPVGVVVDVIVNGKNGVLTDFNERAYANGILKLLRDEALRQKIERNASKTIQNEFTWDKLVKGLEKFYDELL
jgi:glycosyltransferase involved in cell wall biosynthesis